VRSVKSIITNTRINKIPDALDAQATASVQEELVVKLSTFAPVIDTRSNIDASCTNALNCFMARSANVRVNVHKTWRTWE
jgi:hypothetical protein